MALHRRSPRNLSMAITPLQASLAPQTLIAAVQAAWPGVVGELVAEQASPVSERAGTVTVSCQAAVWAQELELMSEDIVAGLNAAVATGRITDLRCIVGDR